MKIEILVKHKINVDGDKCTELCLMTNCTDEFGDHYFDWEFSPDLEVECKCNIHNQEIKVELSSDEEYDYTAKRCQACLDTEIIKGG